VHLLDPLLDPLRSGIDRRAMLEVVLLGASCGALGFWVVNERLSYAAESLAHGMLPGLVLAALAGLPLLLGAVGGVLAATVLIAAASRDPRIGADTATGVVVTGLLGLGALLALTPEAPQRLQELLFGDPLGVSDSDLVAAGVLTVAGTGVLAALHRPLCALAFDDAGAGALGVPTGRLRLLLLGLLAVAVAVAVQGLGTLLALAVLVAPPVAVRPWSHSPGRAIVLAAAAGAAAGVTGIYASYHAGTAAGASVALALCFAALVGSGLPRRLRPGPAAAHSGA
jgi:ABC-type Mn2+/Zn2+ transport system permease subunit